MHWAVFPGHSFTLLHIALNLLLDSSALWTPGALFGCLSYLVSPLPDHWFPLFWVLGACSASVGLCSLESALQSDGLFLPFGFFQLNFCVESDPSCCLFNFCPGFLSRAGGETTVAGDERVTSLSHALTRLYSVKYLFLHYFTRVVFTKTLQKFPKHRHAEEKAKKIYMCFTTGVPTSSGFSPMSFPCFLCLVVLNRSLLQCLSSLSLNPLLYLHLQYSLPKIHPWLPTHCQTNHFLWLVWIWLLLSSSPTLSSSVGSVG